LGNAGSKEKKRRCADTEEMEIVLHVAVEATPQDAELHTRLSQKRKEKKRRNSVNDRCRRITIGEEAPMGAV
jgi:hypothetical protein